MPEGYLPSPLPVTKLVLAGLGFVSTPATVNAGDTISYTEYLQFNINLVTSCASGYGVLKRPSTPSNIYFIGCNGNVVVPNPGFNNAVLPYCEQCAAGQFINNVTNQCEYPPCVFTMPVGVVPSPLPVLLTYYATGSNYYSMYAGATLTFNANVLYFDASSITGCAPGFGVLRRPGGPTPYFEAFCSSTTGLRYSNYNTLLPYCEPCPAGQVVNTTTNQCEPCPDGQVINAVTYQCEVTDCRVLVGPGASTKISFNRGITTSLITGPTFVNLPRGSSGTLNGYCTPATFTSQADSWINPTTSFACPTGSYNAAITTTLQVPRCVKQTITSSDKVACIPFYEPDTCYLFSSLTLTYYKWVDTIQKLCPNSLQVWNGQECVCPSSVADLCQSCGPLGNCNGRGACNIINSTGSSFCTCNDGYSGEYCEIAPSKDECTDVTTGRPTKYCELNYWNWQCDCGVKWLNPVNSLNGYTITPCALNTTLDWADHLINRTLPLDTSRLILNQPVGSLRQAKFSVASDPKCDGFTLVINTLLMTPIKLVKTEGASFALPSWLQGYTTGTYEIHQIDRFSAYKCTSMDLNAYWYYFGNGGDFKGYRSEIELMYAKGSCAAPDACGAKSIPFDKLSTTSNWYIWANLHWKLHGHKRRYSPNPSCRGLWPTLWDTESKCTLARDGCDQVGSSLNTAAASDPCSGNGYCQVNTLPVSIDSKPYRCQCKSFSDLSLSGLTIPKYMGYACQHDSLAPCLTGGQSNQTNFCNFQENRCQPFNVRPMNISVQLISARGDFYPGCNCEAFIDADTGVSVPAARYTGTYCDISRCGVDDCNSKRDGLSVCNQQTNSCDCGYNALGRYCEIDASKCVYPGNSNQCNEQGTCMANGLDGAAYGSFPNYSFNTTWCRCGTGFNGPYCIDATCAPSILVPGRGTCLSGTNLGCYPVYDGFNCNITLCENSGGVTLNKNACICSKDKGLTINVNATNAKGLPDPSCWPRCPETNNNQVCGNNTINSCTSTQNSQGVKSAFCQCSELNGWIPLLVTNDPAFGGANVTSCERFCINGDLNPLWSLSNRNAPCSCYEGFTSDTTNPRCDQDICAPNGEWQDGKCKCKPLWGGIHCNTNMCDNPDTPGLEPDGSPSGSICLCNGVYQPTNQVTRQDCNSNICGEKGRPNLAYDSSTSIINKCTCDPYYRTAPCKTGSDCTPYCSSSYCENGGYPNTTNPSACVCYFPFFSNQPNGYCSTTNCTGSVKVNGYCKTNECGINGVPVTNGCVCQNQWTSPNSTAPVRNGICTAKPCCNTSPCKNGGVWNQTSLNCKCNPTKSYIGTYCDVYSTANTTPPPPLQCGLYGVSILDLVCACSYGWSGTLCNVSPCLSLFNATSLKCECTQNYYGSSCDVYIPPTTTSPPTTTPTPTSPPPPVIIRSKAIVAIDLPSVVVVIVTICLWLFLF